MTLSLLNIGCTDKYSCNKPSLTFANQDIHITTLDADPQAQPDILHDFTDPLPKEWIGKFDILYLSHVLEHILRAKLAQVMTNCRFALREKGELWIYVPSLEWACKEILAGRETMVVQGALYGGQKDELDLHRCAFTLQSLVQLVAHQGFDIKQAGTGKFLCGWGDKVYEIPQNVVVGVKRADSLVAAGD